MGVYKVESCVCVVFGRVQFVSNSFISFEVNWVVMYWFGILVRWTISDCFNFKREITTTTTTTTTP